jgi:hypothetical protein
MNTTWHTENGRLACRWSELPQCVPYNPGWTQEGKTTVAVPATPSFLDFRRFSGLGGRRWFEPDPGYGC